MTDAWLLELNKRLGAIEARLEAVEGRLQDSLHCVFNRLEDLEDKVANLAPRVHALDKRTERMAHWAFEDDDE